MTRSVRLNPVVCRFGGRFRVRKVLRTPSYRLHRPSGQAVVTLGGQDVYLGKHGTPDSRAAYDPAVAEWLAGGRRSTRQVSATVNMVVCGYLDHVDGRYRSSEPANIRLELRPLRRLYGSTPAAEFGPLCLKAVRDDLVGQVLCRSKVNKRTRRIVRTIKRVVVGKLVPAAVHQSLKAVECLRFGQGGVRELATVRPISVTAVDAIRPQVS